MRHSWSVLFVLVGGIALGGCNDNTVTGPAADGGQDGLGVPGDASPRPVADASSVGEAAVLVDADNSDGPAPDGGPLVDGAMPDANLMLDGGAPVDGAPVDASLGCGALGQACVNGASCCSGICDPQAKVCSAPPNICAGFGAVCASPTDCCSLRCTAGKCAAQCQPNANGCAAAGDCCSGNCQAGTCQPVAMGCATLGNKCAVNGDCCSMNCQGGLCAPQGGGCNAIGDVCFKNADCCSGSCTIPAGLMAGTCAVVNAGGGGNCTKDGEPCSGCGGCCSHVCAPTATGGHICAAASGCKVTGDICHQDTDCCGGGNTGLPGANEVSCNLIAGVNPPVGTCSNPRGCDPDGDVCGLAQGNNTCGNARHDCCNCLPPKINCCKFDRAGVPRCYGGSTQQCPSGYTGTAPCCINAGQICAFSNECCNGAPCVPDANGQPRCGSMCAKVGEACTADADCCAGEPCTIPRGQLVGTCGAPPPPPPPPPDMLPPPDLSMPPPPDMAGQKPNDLSMPPPDLMPRPCSLIGQSCSTVQPCCGGLVCTPPSGTGNCLAGELDCSCLTGVF